SLIFGRISEEIDALNTAGVSWKIVPGITAASGAAASNGIPLTCRTDSHAVTYITAHNKQGVLDIDWEIATRPNHTVVFYMGLSLIDRIADTLLQRGVPSHTPFHIIANATRPNEFALHSTLGDIISDVEQYEIPSPALLILGPDRRVTETADDQTHVRLGLPQSY
ncbi:MAG: uroporphyrin-III C-methyltransferase/precorrin-2 dehydrogenase/sirohydrochlorin ferrochelatase, partial [Candidatus Azotimanducaceae bacterium]